ncbi:DISP1-like protein [Mya arenaria]|uniref:DISP1-like protein n=1 Tax=Mya arenaria TaxID=6604 RepID=A0ABY7F880_MYAAR|nr:uncharacterized protein LOC128207360 [Mya arenaria]WAR18412.1 DISP1-like protein [Mya arenaria]
MSQKNENGSGISSHLEEDTTGDTVNEYVSKNSRKEVISSKQSDGETQTKNTYIVQVVHEEMDIVNDPSRPEISIRHNRVETGADEDARGIEPKIGHLTNLPPKSKDEIRGRIRRKKKRERRHVQGNSGDETDNLDGVKKLKKKRRPKALKSSDAGHENAFINGNYHSHIQAELIAGAVPPHGNKLWIGNNNDLHPNITNDEPNELRLDLSSIHGERTEHGNVRQENGVPFNSNADIFTASAFSPRVKTNIVDNENTTSGMYVKNNGAKKSTKSRLKPKRVNLKRTSSKVSVVGSQAGSQAGSPRSSRLDPAKTARSAWSRQDTHEGRDGDQASRKPLLFCKLIARFPVACFTFLTVLHVAVIGLTVGLAFTGYDIFPAVFDTLPLHLYNTERLKELSWKSKQVFDDFIYRPVYGYSYNAGYRGRVKDTFEVIFESSDGGNIFTAENLELIKLTENKLYGMERYKDDFCLWDQYYYCVRPQSLIRLFDGTYSSVNDVFYDPTFSNITEVIYQASIHNETREYLELFIGKDRVITQDNCYTSITRTMVLMGWPLYIIGDKYGKEEDIQHFLDESFKPETERLRDFTLVDLLDVYYISKLLYEYDLVQQALEDIKLAIGSVLFIFVFMCFQTGSVIITFLGILSIFSSFLLTNLFYRYILQYKYFGFFHVIAIFLILGIGADDLFVFYDTWRLTGHTKYPDDAHRLSDCYRKAAKTTFVTSVTTMTAFLVSGLSPLLPVKTFGIFSGILVGLNYLWVILYFPTVIMLHHTKTKFIWIKFRSLMKKCGSCMGFKCCNNQKDDGVDRRHSLAISDASESKSLADNNSTRQLINDNIKSPSSEKSYASALHFRPQPLPPIASISSELEPGTAINQNMNMAFMHHVPSPIDLGKIESETIREEFAARQQNKPRKNFEDRNKVVVFLRNGFYDFMTKRAVKITVPLLLLAVSIFFIHRATLIQPDAQQVRLFRSSHNYAKATTRHYGSFLRDKDDEYQRLYLVWGLGEADIKDCDLRSGEYCFGKPTWDSEFDMNNAEAQLATKALCERLEGIDRDYAETLRIQWDQVTGKPRIHCFTADFEDYFQLKLSEVQGYTNVSDLGLPVSSTNVSALMAANPYIYRESLPDDFQDYFEILVEYWLTNGYSLTPTADYLKYNWLLGTTKVPNQTHNAFYPFSGLYYGTRLKYMAVEVNTTMNVFSLGFDEGLPVYDQWEHIIADINANMPPPLKNGIQLTESLWHWLFVQKTLADSAITGILVGLLSAWPILVFTTLNIAIGTIAAVTIGLVTACVIGIIPLAGWKLGVLESINLCMVVGLSVDYIVHLAEAYRSSPSTRRADRVRYMLESIGLSVISGAITTIGAAVFMLFAQIQFFFQFGIFIITTVGIALVFSLFGFTTFLSLFGPEENTGSVLALATGCYRMVAKRENDIDNEKDGAEKERCRKWPCASPSIILDRFYDWLSYGYLK